MINNSLHLRIYFYKGAGSLYDRAIRWWTNSPYSHCAVTLTDVQGDITLYEAIEGDGVRRAHVVDEIDLRPSQWDYIDIPVSSESWTRVGDWCNNERGCGYDWLGMLLSQVLFIPREHPDKWFCSEFAAAALELLGLLYGAKPCTFSPGSLWRVMRGPCG